MFGVCCTGLATSRRGCARRSPASELPALLHRTGRNCTGVDGRKSPDPLGRSVQIQCSDVLAATSRTLQINWWAKQFAGKSVAEITVDVALKARDACGTETFTRGEPHKDRQAGEMIRPKEHRRSGATVKRRIVTPSHGFSFAVKDRRPIEPDPVDDIRRKKESQAFRHP